MKRLKNSLRFKIFIVLFFMLIYSYYFNVNFKSKYKDENIIYGYVTKYTIESNYTTIYLNGKEKILCKYNGNFKYKLGDYLKLEGKLKKPNKNTLFGLYNYRDYLKHEYINYIFDTKNIVKLRDNTKIRYKIKNYILNIIDKKENKPYLYTFILGNTKYINEDVLNSYRINGISHLFAVSGMHVSIIFAIILKIFKKFKYKQLFAIFFIIFYMFLTDFSPSILRAGIFIILITINKKYKLNLDYLDLMVILLIICILIDPFILYKIGFQYSYFISLSLLYFNDKIKKQNNKIKTLFVISLISFLVSLPITINNFNKINFLSIFLNIFYVPLVSIFIFPINLISFVFPIPFLNNIMHWFEQLTLLISKLDFFTFNFPKISIILIIIYYFVLFNTIKKLSFHSYKSNVILISIIVLFKLLPFLNFNYEIVYIDVNQGDSILIKMPNNMGNILIDTGGIYNTNSNSHIIKNTINYLNLKGIESIQYLILTHGDFDHMGEAINLVNNFKVEKVIFNCGEFNDLEQELIRVLDKKKIPYYLCIKELNIDKNKLFFLQTKEYDDENDNSNVIYTELNDYKFMFMGDASINTEKEILNTYNLSDIDVLKIGHHGSRTSSSEEFINRINPKYSIISVGKNNRYGHPNKEVLDNLRYSKIYRTDQDGSIMFKIKNNKLKIETCSP